MKFAISLALLGVVAFGCDRRTEPFVPGEKPQQPDLAKIFPAGAERADSDAVLPAPPNQRGAPPFVQTSAAVSGNVTLAAELQDDVPEGAVLFLIARSSAQGPPMAVKRILDPEFPLAFTIGPEDRMMEQLPFQGPMQISARIDSDGNATTRGPLDLQGAAPGAHHPGASGVSVVIDERQSDAPGATPIADAGSPQGAISGTVSLAAQLVDAVPAGALLFLIARTSETGPPLAVKRIVNPTFPLEFTIGPDDRMIPSTPFAGAIRISARVDADGNAMSQTPGDLFGASERPQSPGASGVDVIVDGVVPAG